jgi:hypothetical protein
MSKTVKYLIIIVVAYLAIIFLIKMGQRKKYLSFLHELGMNIADNFTPDELKTAYLYLHDYARKYSANAPTVLKNTDPTLYKKAKQVSDKYKIFNL